MLLDNTLFIDKNTINKSKRIKSDAVPQKLRRNYPKEVIYQVRDEILKINPDVKLKSDLEIMRIKLYLTNGYSLESIICSSPDCNSIKRWNKSDSRWELFCSPECRQNNKKLWKDLRHKTLKTENQSKYGVDNVSQLKWVQLKKEKTTLKNYGVKNPFQIYEYKHLYINNQKRRSKIEIELNDFIVNNGVDTITLWQDLGIEFDIYVPDKKIAIEYNGIYWHSLGKNNFEKYSQIKRQHLKKLEIALDFGVKLLQIFETDDIDIWKSVILAHLNKSKKIYAKQTSIKLISPEEANIFFKKNHLQGSLSAPINYGLYYDGNLVAAMNFLKSGYSKEEYELGRFCNLKNCVVVGGASKLLKNFEADHKPKSLISYADRRWSNGGLYKKLGFTLKEIRQPNRFIVKGSKLLSWVDFQKHNLESNLEKFSSKKTDIISIIENNYRIIWDCGNLKFIKEYL